MYCINLRKDDIKLRMYKIVHVKEKTVEIAKVFRLNVVEWQKFESQGKTRKTLTVHQDVNFTAPENNISISSIRWSIQVNCV